MANTIAQSFITQWNAEVHQLFQDKGFKLKEAIRTVNDVTGSTYKFHNLGSVTANQKTRGADVTGLTPAHTTVTATLEDWYAPLYIDKMDELKTNASFRKEFVQASVKALGRQADDIVIAALDASTPGATVTATSGLTYAKVTEALTALNSADVDPEDRVFVISPEALEDMLLDEKLTSQDYVAVRNVLSGNIDTALGFTFIMSTRLSVNTGVRNCYAFSKQAVGCAMGCDVKTDIDYIPEKVSTLVNSYMSMGAVAIDEAGIVLVQVTE